MSALITLNSGHKIPQLGLGTWLSKPGEVATAVRNALHLGYRHIDCAMAYQNQAEIGAVFKDVLGVKKVNRSDLFVTSKIWNTFHSTAQATEAITSILKDLELTYIDLLLIHWPQGYQEQNGLFPKDDAGVMQYSDVDYLETWRAMEAAVERGLVRSIGVSNFNRGQIERLLEHGTIPPANLQIEIHPYLPQWDLVEWCKGEGIRVTGFSPLANPSHMFRNSEQPQLLEEPLLIKIAKHHERTPAQVALRWSIQRGLIVIPKSVKKTRLAENFDVFDFELSAYEMDKLATLERGLRLLPLDRDLKHPHYPFH